MGPIAIPPVNANASGTVTPVAGTQIDVSTTYNGNVGYVVNETSGVSNITVSIDGSIDGVHWDIGVVGPVTIDAGDVGSIGLSNSDDNYYRFYRLSLLGSAGSTPTVVGTNWAEGDGDTVTLAWSPTTTAGDYLAVAVMVLNTAGVPVFPAGWSMFTSVDIISTCTLYIFVYPNAPATTNTTITFATSALAIVALELSSPISVDIAGSNVSTVPGTTASVTGGVDTNHPNELAIFFASAFASVANLGTFGGGVSRLVDAINADNTVVCSAGEKSIASPAMPSGSYSGLALGGYWSIVFMTFYGGYSGSALVSGYAQ